MRVALLLCFMFAGCFNRYREDLDYSHAVEEVHAIPESGSYSRFVGVSWTGAVGDQLRRMIVDDEIAAGRDVWHVDARCGVLAVACLAHGADRVVTTSRDNVALDNVRYNLAIMRPDGAPESFEATGPPTDVLRDEDRFDLILAIAPPADASDVLWMNQVIQACDERLRTGGRGLVVFGDRDAAKTFLSTVDQAGLRGGPVGDRKLEDLPENFLPGVVMEVRRDDGLDALDDGGGGA